MVQPRTRWGAFALACATLSISTAAGAAAPGGQVVFDAESLNYAPPPTVRRGGFAMSLSTGFGAGNYQGYELSVSALNDPDQRQSTGASVATWTTLWAGGAPRDWITLGLGFTSISASGPEIIGSGAVFIAHVEGYPFFSWGRHYEDLGIGLSGGIGVVNLVDAEERDFSDPLATSGSLSMLSFDVFWEPWRLWHCSFGPSLNYTHGFSQTMDLHQVTLGLRSALYGVQPKKKREGG